MIFNHVLSQILNHQLKLEHYRKAQKAKIWQNELDTYLNNQIQVGILGAGFIGTIVGQNLQKLNYNVAGFKNTSVKEEKSIEDIQEESKSLDKKNLQIAFAKPVTATRRASFTSIHFVNLM